MSILPFSTMPRRLPLLVTVRVDGSTETSDTNRRVMFDFRPHCWRPAGQIEQKLMDLDDVDTAKRLGTWVPGWT